MSVSGSRAAGHQPSDDVHRDAPSERIDITPLHVERLHAGATDAVPIVLLHGFTGDATTWAAFVEAWAAGDRLSNGPSLSAVDLVGHGRSPDPDDPAAYRLEAQAASVVAALESQGIDRAVWLGYSMGGRVAVTVALAQPERVAALVLVSTSPGIADDAARAERAAADEVLAATVEADGIGPFVEDWARHALFATQDALGPEHAEAMRVQRLGNRAPAIARTLRAAGAGAMRPLWDRLGELAMPVLVVSGALDGKYTAIGRAMAESINAWGSHGGGDTGGDTGVDARGDAGVGARGSASHVVVAGAGHALQLEAAEALAERVRSWYADRQPRDDISPPSPGTIR